ncbi:predicted protein [Postia placenta Mad-698-R]|nr:predicted protein [Postia placenta Mad-698-R]
MAGESVIRLSNAGRWCHTGKLSARRSSRTFNCKYNTDMENKGSLVGQIHAGQIQGGRGENARHDPTDYGCCSDDASTLHLIDPSVVSSGAVATTAGARERRDVVLLLAFVDERRRLSLYGGQEPVRLTHRRVENAWVDVSERIQGEGYLSIGSYFWSYLRDYDVAVWPIVTENLCIIGRPCLIHRNVLRRWQAYAMRGYGQQSRHKGLRRIIEVISALLSAVWTYWLLDPDEMS